MGSSGVGKSTLINKLIGTDKMNTNTIRNDDKGRHTTTHRELILLPQGGIVIDTPGMRELGMWEQSDGLDKSFSDVDAFLYKCRFRNCTHTSEPGCAVNKAIKKGYLSQKRWNDYCKLKTEAAFSGNKETYLSEKEKKFKNISKALKAQKKK